MGKTIAEKIISKHTQLKKSTVVAGDVVLVKPDFIFAQDGTAGLVIDTLLSLKSSSARRKLIREASRCGFVIDHSSPSPQMSISKIHNKIRNFAKENDAHLFDIGNGVCHQVIPEGGFALPGRVVIGADSHTCTYGALGCCATGLGSTDVAIAMYTGYTWMKVPATFKIVCKGKLEKGVYAKDLILYIIGKLSAEGANYKAVEFYGDAISRLNMDGRFTITNMVVEMGAKFGIIPPDKKTIAWLKEHNVSRKYEIVHADKNATYEREYEFDVKKIGPQVATPHKVDNAVPIEKVIGTPISEAFLGTCTNGRYEDLYIAATILKNRRIHRDVKFIVAPASRKIMLKAMKTGVLSTLIESGAVVISPGCGPCVGTHGGIPADGENVISTANRNFKGRMGNPEANIYLASPATVAASAIEGKIADPRKYLTN